MPGLNIFLFSQQNLTKSGIISATINCSSSIYADASTTSFISSLIFGTSQISEALLYNYLADKRIKHPMHLISDDIPIGHLVCPKPIEEIIVPLPPAPCFIPAPNLSIMKSCTMLSNPFRPQLITELIPPPPSPTPYTPPVDPAITKTYLQLADPLKPKPIIHSKARL